MIDNINDTTQVGRIIGEFNQGNVVIRRAYKLIFNKWWSCVVSNKRGRVSALLGPHQHALVRM